MLRNNFFVNIGPLSDCCSNEAIEDLAKAMSGERGDDPDIWAQHESPFVARMIELFSSRGLLRIEAVQTELIAWIDGQRHVPHAGAPLTRPDGMMLRWTPEELALVRLYLQSLPRAEFTLDDWGLVVDYLVQRYLPASELKTEAEWLAVRSTLMGKVQANLGAAVSHAAADALLAAMPNTVEKAIAGFRFADAIPQIMQFARVRCADQVVGLSDKTRHNLKSVILDHQSKVFAGDPQATRQSLEQRLFDTFGALNRDWRRIAVTEAGENANQGVIASLKPGTRVRRVEQYRGACPYCRKIDGAVLTVVDPAEPKKDGKLQVWVGKNNIGRSSAKRKRVGDDLVERTPAELWWPPAGAVHPHCRGVWHVMDEAQPTDSPDFQAWLDLHFHKVKTAP